MKPEQAFELIRDVQRDYVAMVRELNGLKRSVNPVDPWKLPLVERMEQAKRELGLACGMKQYMPRQDVKSAREKII